MTVLQGDHARQDCAHEQELSSPASYPPDQREAQGSREATPTGSFQGTIPDEPPGGEPPREPCEGEPRSGEGAQPPGPGQGAPAPAGEQARPGSSSASADREADGSRGLGNTPPHKATTKAKAAKGGGEGEAHPPPGSPPTSGDAASSSADLKSSADQQKPGPQVLQERVDTLHLHATVLVRRDVYDRMDDLKRQLRLARVEMCRFDLCASDTPQQKATTKGTHEHGADTPQQKATTKGEPLAVDGLGRGQFALMATGAKEKPYRLANADCSVLLGYGQLNLRIEFGAMACATHKLTDLVEYAEEIVQSIGEYPAQSPGLVVSRIDLAVDVAGVAFTVHDRDGFVSRAKRASDYATKKTRKVADDGATPPGSIDTHYQVGTGELTGFSFSRGNPLSARLYRKDIELQRYSATDQKVRTEHKIWSDKGWTKGQPVWRLEAQIRGPAVKELNLRVPSQLDERINPAWQYFSCRWLRLVVQAGTRRQRRKTQPRWELFQGRPVIVPGPTRRHKPRIIGRERFQHTAMPVERKRADRGGADAPQLLGTAVSYLVRGRQYDEIVAKHGPPIRWDMPTLVSILSSSVAAALENQLERSDAAAWEARFRSRIDGTAAVKSVLQVGTDDLRDDLLDDTDDLLDDTG